MSSSFEKSVKGATKIKNAPPKSKYIEHILIATHSGEAGVAEVFRALQNRLRDSTWTVVFKSLITVHLMIREGSQDVTLAYLSRHRNMLAISAFSDVQTQGRNIRHYSNYLTERARAYRDTKIDFVRGADGRLEKLSVEKGLLRETEAVQHQVMALLKCNVLDAEPENEITITVFRMLVLDLLALFQILNQAMINLLGRFFEMSKVDAERALEIYTTFARQTEVIVSYLQVARSYEHQTRVEVPKLKHAPLNLGKQLADYVNDPDFEVNRRQYLAEQEIKKGKRIGSSTASSSRFDSDFRPAAPPKTAPAAAAAPAAAKGPDPDLIDFFDSIEQNQQPMATQPPPVSAMTSPFAVAQPPPQQYQQTGFMAPGGMPAHPQMPQPQFDTSPFNVQPQPVQPQPTQPVQPVQPAFGGSWASTYSPQANFQPTSLAPIPHDSPISFASPTAQPFNSTSTGQSTNPFRQSIMAQQTGMSPTFTGSPISSPLTRQNTNPFAKSSPVQSPPAVDPTSNQFSQGQVPAAPAAPLQPAPTGTNPFARSNTVARPATSAGLMPQPTGSTNPFRQSTFVNTATGSGWQHNQQPIGGGLDQLETVPVFPRPTQQQAWQP